MNEIQQSQWNMWLRGRPKVVREMAKHLSPNRLYTLKTTGQRVIPTSFNEDGTMTVAVYRFYNPKAKETIRVFGIDPKDVIEVDPDSKDFLMTFEEYHEKDLSVIGDAPCRINQIQ